jgi:hypothetical protein
LKIDYYTVSVEKFLIINIKSSIALGV